MRDVARGGDAREVADEFAVEQVGAERDEARAPRRGHRALADEALRDPRLARAALGEDRRERRGSSLLATWSAPTTTSSPTRPYARFTTHSVRSRRSSSSPMSRRSRVSGTWSPAPKPAARERELRLRVDVREARERAHAAGGDGLRDGADVALAFHVFCRKVPVECTDLDAADRERAVRVERGRGRRREDDADAERLELAAHDRADLEVLGVGGRVDHAHGGAVALEAREIGEAARERGDDARRVVTVSEAGGARELAAGRALRCDRRGSRR